MEKLSYWRLIGEVERIVKARVPGSHPADWTEGTVTAGLLKSLASELDDTEVSGFRQGYTIRLSAHRQRGKRETTNADVSLLVRIRPPGRHRARRRGVRRDEAETGQEEDLRWIPPAGAEEALSIVALLPGALPRL